MSGRVRLALVLAVAAAIASAPTALGATVSDLYWLRGAEYYATPTQGRFAGSAQGSSGDTAVWQATVDHSVVGDTATIWGGTARLATSNLVLLKGQFASGSLQRSYTAPGCGIERFDVSGSLSNVTRSDSAVVGTGVFSAVLTHYRALLFGRCITFSATVTGTIGLAF